jgi:hypothetical protein
MKLQNVIDRIKVETDLLQGEKTRDMTYTSTNTFPTESAAREAFGQSIEKLLNVNDWSALSSFTADFVLHGPTGEPKAGGPPQPGDYIQVSLPGPMPKNWVRVTHTFRDENRAEFTVQPSHDPHETDSDKIEHFFHQQATSLFRVELAGHTITASEIGKNEGINNQEPQAGGRAAINTVIAETGWLFYQQLQWKQLTDYLVHL